MAEHFLLLVLVCMKMAAKTFGIGTVPRNILERKPSDTQNESVGEFVNWQYISNLQRNKHCHTVSQCEIALISSFID